MQFHTVIAAVMKFINEFEPANLSPTMVDYCVLKLVQIMAPLAPHTAEEMWALAGRAYSIFNSEWPRYDPDAIVADTMTIAVQVNGKLRGQIEVDAESNDAAVISAAKCSERVQLHIAGKTIVKEIYIPGRLVNLVVK
jgi:leucyl-tRNA synthetase